MLSSIHPLGERAKQQRWTVTVAAHLIGAIAGGLAIGSAIGALGGAAAAAGVGFAARLGALAVVSFVALGIDARGWPSWLWRPHRQVDENWLISYRGWVYGAGYGVQLGLGISTIVTAATIYALGVCALATGTIAGGAIVGAVFGAGRGVSLMAGRTVTTPERLHAFHRVLHERQVWGRRAAVAGDAVLGLVALALMTTTLAGGVS
jgi:hypothetical protein